MRTRKKRKTERKRKKKAQSYQRTEGIEWKNGIKDEAVRRWRKMREEKRADAIKNEGQEDEQKMRIEREREEEEKREKTREEWLKVPTYPFQKVGIGLDWIIMNRQEIESLIQQLRCANCSGYLICPPIVQLDDGTSVCGNCTPPFPALSPDGSLVRQLALEQILHKFSFPCKYKAEGCRKRLFFGCDNHDEENCVYRPLACPTKICPWSGPMFGVPKHFAESHPAMVKKVLDFKLQVDQDFEETMLAVIDRVPFLAKYVYNADQAELSLSINCLTLDDARYKIWMFNKFVNDYGVSIEREMCFPYTSVAPTALILNMDKYLPVLENPDCVLFSVEMIIEKGDENVVATPPGPANVLANGNLGDLGYGCIDVMPIQVYAMNKPMEAGPSMGY